MIISARVTEENGEQIKAFAFYRGLTVSELLRKALEEQMGEGEPYSESDLFYVREQTKYNTEKSAKRRKGGALK